VKYEGVPFCKTFRLDKTTARIQFSGCCLNIHLNEFYYIHPAGTPLISHSTVRLELSSKVGSSNYCHDLRELPGLPHCGVGAKMTCNFNFLECCELFGYSVQKNTTPSEKDIYNLVVPLLLLRIKDSSAIFGAQRYGL